jgi:hypothetical protein
MARAPFRYGDEGDELSRIQKAEIAHNDSFNRLLGCMALLGICATIVALVVGYWATH